MDVRILSYLATSTWQFLLCSVPRYFLYLRLLLIQNIHVFLLDESRPSNPILIGASMAIMTGGPNRTLLDLKHGTQAHDLTAVKRLVVWTARYRSNVPSALCCRPELTQHAFPHFVAGNADVPRT
jgi:hypothetical protein